MKANKFARYFLYALLLLLGILIGRFLFSHHPSTEDKTAEENHAGAHPQVWTCSMHPQIRQDHPGTCPLCEMDLIPMEDFAASSEGASVPDAIQLSAEAIALADIQTSTVRRGNPVKEIHLYGTIKADERRLHSQVSHVGGRIESLLVNYAGESVREGQTIATIYSPDLLNAQQELIEAKKLAASQPSLLAAARDKLRHWKLGERQISEIEESGTPSPAVNIYANASGIVIRKRVEQGDYVTAGGVLFDMADLSSVWAVFDAYETDLPYLKAGDKVLYTLQTLPGKTFDGHISFIDPVLDKTSRTVKVRVETSNPHLALKPEMYADAVIRSSAKRDEEAIIIPRSAILWTGKRSIVYVKDPEVDIPSFSLREIELGASLGEEYVVLSGIEEGEEIVSSGAFVVDASAQLGGKPSMMNRD
ncbi:MAG: efflux RND transporter periplasmic adaptor subunit [Tannerellaceae bacterium]|nr:efflux RND transporter periplasmic adaptor subunit [Tannerellaceae bacterium]